MSHLLKCRHALSIVRVILFPVEENEGELGDGTGEGDGDNNINKDVNFEKVDENETIFIRKTK
jgi:hypothetical protein